MQVRSLLLGVGIVVSGLSFAANQSNEVIEFDQGSSFEGLIGTWNSNGCEVDENGPWKLVFPILGEVWSGIDLISKQIEIIETSEGIKINSSIYDNRGGTYSLGRTFKTKPWYTSHVYWDLSNHAFVVRDAAVSQGFVKRELVLQLQSNETLTAKYTRRIVGGFGVKHDVVLCDFVRDAS